MQDCKIVKFLLFNFGTPLYNVFRGKIIQVHRNPADVAVSFYHHLKKEVKGSALAYDWDEFITKLYCDDKISKSVANTLNCQNDEIMLFFICLFI